MNKRNWAVTVTVVSLVLTLPYIAAALLAGRDSVFAGFLLNPIDGASYLAKMMQGYAGAWKFTLPFTAEPGEGAYLFTFYLFLGHLARWLGIPLILVFHAARLFGAACLLLALDRFYQVLFAEQSGLRKTAWWLTLLGSGMGWLLLFAGYQSADLLVAEAYPFLSMFANPHFPLGLALILLSFSLLLEGRHSYRLVLLLVIGLLIAVILPFGEVLALLVAGVWCAWTWAETRCLHWQPVVALGLLGGPFLLYQFWAAQTDPVLAGWNAQNITLSPPWWDFLLSFSPVLLLALPGCIALARAKTNPARCLLLAWFGIGLLLVYFPFSLQRRFMLGLYIPAAALAVFGIDYLRQRFAAQTRALTPLTFGLALPSNILLIVIMLFGVMSHSPAFYLSRDEAQALAWIKNFTPPGAIVLAAPEMGRFIPAFSGRRVIYGHPFETVDALREEARVRDFYTSAAPDRAFLATRKVAYLFYGPREQQLGSRLDLSALPVVFDSGSVRVYAVPGTP